MLHGQRLFHRPSLQEGLPRSHKQTSTHTLLRVKLDPDQPRHSYQDIGCTSPRLQALSTIVGDHPSSKFPLLGMVFDIYIYISKRGGLGLPNKMRMTSCRAGRPRAFLQKFIHGGFCLLCMSRIQWSTSMSDSQAPKRCRLGDTVYCSSIITYRKGETITVAACSERYFPIRH